MGCDDGPVHLLPSVVRDATMRDVEALETRVIELERLVGALRDSMESLFDGVDRLGAELERMSLEGRRA